MAKINHFLFVAFFATGVLAPLAVSAISIDVNKTPIKDQRKIRAGTGVGYAGNMSDDGANSGTGRDLFVKYFIEQPDECWKILKAGGHHVCREWSANDRWQERISPFKAKDEKERKAIEKLTGYDGKHDWNKIAYDFRKQHGIRTLLTLENYSVCTNYVTGARSEDIEDVKRVILEFVKWIVDNGYKDQVIGFELGNEPYFGDEPELFAERWAQIVPGIKQLFPEVDIGFTCAEYRDGDPDIEAVRRRSTAVDKWFEGGSYFGFQKVNQWTGRFIVAFSNGLEYCNHVIYHFYGGDVADGMGPCGFGRIRHFAKAFPEVKDMRVWITEYRERSDEDCRCQQMHSSTITKAHYILSTTGAPMFDCTSIHQVSALSGGFCVANGKGGWVVQWDPAGRDFSDPDYTGSPRIEVGPAGPLYRMYNEALMDHPIILEHGGGEGPRDAESCWTGVLFYGYTHALQNWHTNDEAWGKTKRPKSRGGPQWICAANPERDSLVFLVCNSSDDKWDVPMDFPGYRVVGKPHYHLFRCEKSKLQLHQIPGEPRPTWEEDYLGDDPGRIQIPDMTIATVEYKLEKPIASVGLLTDTHVTADTNSCKLLAKAFAKFNSLGIRDVLHAGDIADSWDPKAYANYAATRGRVFTNGLPREVFAFGFHDILNSKANGDWGKAETVWKDVAARLGAKNAMYDTFEIGGFVFAVAPEWPDRAKYEKLVTEAVAKAGKDRPVFLLQHRPPYGTTHKSSDFGSPDTYVRDDMKTLTREFLNRHPNLIVMSGHVHNNLRHEGGVWQGEFSAVSLGCLQRYGEPYYGSPVPAVENANVLVMSIFKDSATFTRYDLNTGAAIGNAWEIGWPYASAKARYTPETLSKRCGTGVMVDKVKVAADGDGRLKVTFTEACSEGVQPENYRMRVDLYQRQQANVDGADESGKPVETYVGTAYARGAWDQSGNFRVWDKNKRSASVTFSGALVDPGNELRIVVRPESYAGVLGKPLELVTKSPLKAVGWVQTWRGEVKGEPIAAWPFGKRFALPAEAMAGKKGDRFRVSFNFEGDGDADFAIVDDAGKAIPGGYPVAGKCEKRRYALDFDKTSEASAFAIRLSSTLATGLAVTDVKVEKLQ